VITKISTKISRVLFCELIDLIDDNGVRYRIECILEVDECLEMFLVS
jgi:hypothetical protein